MSDHVEERVEHAPGPARPERPRGVPPVAIPILALIGMLILVFSVSRILLAVSHTAASAIALFFALNVLVGAALVSAGRWVRDRRPSAFPLILLSGLLVVAAGAVAWGLGGGEEHGPEGVGVPIVAEGIAFTTDDLLVPADEALLIEFDNRDAATDHNVHVFEGEPVPAGEQPGPSVFGGEIITGPARITYELPEGLPAGVFNFICDVHPNMVGKITAEVGAEPPGEGTASPEPTPTAGEESPPASSGADVTAEGLEFSALEITEAAEGGSVTIVFENADSVPHNIAVTNGDSADAEELFAGDFVTAETTEYTFDVPGPGDYFFYCQAHPEMQGTLKVE